MKKVLSVILLTLFVLSVFTLSSCKKTNADPNSVNTESYGVDVACNGDSSLPKCRFFADKSEAAPGDTVNVTFRMSDVKNLCCVSADMIFDTETVSFVKDKSFSDNDYYNMVNTTGNKVVYNGYVMTTVDFDSRDLITASFKINENAQSGSETVITLDISELLIGLEPSGSETKEVCSNYSDAELAIKIK